MTAQVVVSPNPVPAYSTFTMTGCGYKPNVGVQFNLYAPGVTAVWGGTIDGNGCLEERDRMGERPGERDGSTCSRAA